ncbi:MAG: GyrI-like domain-containing protein [Bdellovibrionaceae bacterium]|nr:GyrI-like domain-containing protein [Pseudobdellovibrionaceae bacterium]
MVTLGSWMAYYLGAFKSVEINSASRPAMKMIYKEHVGSYHKIVAVIQEVETWAKSQGIDCTQSFGEYIDDANMVEEIRLRSRGGCIVREIPKTLPEGFKSQEIPERSYVTAIFEGSPGIGPVKVYPKAEVFMRENGLVMDGPVIEIYVIHSEKEMTTTYLFPLAKPAEKSEPKS